MLTYKANYIFGLDKPMKKKNFNFFSMNTEAKEHSNISLSDKDMSIYDRIKEYVLFLMIFIGVPLITLATVAIFTTLIVMPISFLFGVL